MSSLFTGIRVLAVARVVAAPFAAYQLALNGADVITIEDPERGDSQRHADSTPDFVGRGMGLGFLAFNANKRSMTLDLKSEEGRGIFRELAKSADVVIENLRAGTLSRYGIGYEDLKSINPRLIFCSVTGYGQTGPKKSDPGIDDAIQAASGLMSLTGTPESGPLKTGAPLVDYTTGYVAAFAIASALFHRTRTGVGQSIDISMLETAMSVMSADVTRAITLGENPPLAGNASIKKRYVSNSFKCKSGVLMVAARSENLRNRFWKAIDRTDIPQDPRFREAQDCVRNLEQLHAEIGRTLAEKTAAEWEGILNAAGVPAMRVLALTEALDGEQIRHRGFLHRMEADKETGLPGYWIPKPPYRMSAVRTEVSSPPPRLGQHTDQIMKELNLVPSPQIGSKV